MVYDVTMKGRKASLYPNQRAATMSYQHKVKAKSATFINNRLLPASESSFRGMFIDVIGLELADAKLGL